MNRQEAIEILTGRYLIPVEDGAYEHAERVNNALDMAIDALNYQTVFEQIKWERDMALQTLEEHGIGLGQKSDWIPVSERLPEDGIAVLITTENEEVYIDQVITDPYKERYFQSNTGYDNFQVIAWKPLPKPYKESEE